MPSRFAPVVVGMIAIHVAYSQTAAPLSFEAASIKPNTGAANGTGAVDVLPGGRLRAQNALVRAIIQNAYEVKPFQIVGGPAWIDSARYDIEAKAAGETTPSETLRMLQVLLAERFQLRVHHETREAPVYTLNPAKSGLKAADPNGGDCAAGARQAGGLPCGRVMARIQLPNARLEGAQVQMADLTRVLANLLWRPVIDRTGYTEKFNLKLEFAADSAIGLLAGPYRPDAAPPVAADPGGVSIFTAMQEQLGLKLEAGKGPVDVLVIDRIEPPSAN